MYRVLIVDDERPARETLVYLINWEKTGFEIAESAKNGNEALEKYFMYKPDLIITDIQMPVMDGLELIRQVRLHDNEMKFVILSCHENFQYAREAFRMGVTDYLLKDLLTQDDLYILLEKVKGDLEKNSTKNVNTVNLIEWQDDNEYKDECKSSALKTIVFEDSREIKYKDFVEKYQLNFKRDYFVLLCIHVDDCHNSILSLNYIERKQRINQIINIIRRSLDSMHGGECFYNENGEFVAIACLEEITSQLKLIADCHTVCRTIREKIYAIEGLSITIGVSNGFHKFNEVNARFSEALNAAKLKIFIGKGKNLFYNTRLANGGRFDPDILDKRINKIKVLLEEGDIKGIQKEVNSLYNDDLKGFMQYNYLKHVNSCMFNLIVEYCSKQDIGYDDIFGLKYIPMEQPEKYETVQEISQWFSDVFAKMFDVKNQKGNKIYSRRIKDAINYIHENYVNEISLEQISEQLGLHKNYLCRLFKQETGENITDFIGHYRIEKAKQLIISTNYKLYEIAQKVGFSNAQQFSFNFKRITGQTPADFREGNT